MGSWGAYLPVTVCYCWGPRMHRGSREVSVSRQVNGLGRRRQEVIAHLKVSDGTGNPKQERCIQGMNNNGGSAEWHAALQTRRCSQFQDGSL